MSAESPILIAKLLAGELVALGDLKLPAIDDINAPPAEADLLGVNGGNLYLAVDGPPCPGWRWEGAAAATPSIRTSIRRTPPPSRG